MPNRERKRDKLRWSKIYTFSCIRPTAQLDTDDAPFSLQGPGFSRVVFCNQPGFHRKKPFKYTTNIISTTKYNVLTFFPKALFEQFRRVANIYFLFTAIFSLTPLSSLDPFSMVAPLAFVIGLSMLKEGLEDWNRFIQDLKVNKRKVNIHKEDGVFGKIAWQKISVGDIVRVEKDQFFPADLLLISSSYDDGICYVETMNLDGETNLKIKRSLETTLLFEDGESFKDFKATIRCEDPNPDLYNFVGNFEYAHEVIPLNTNQILLRDSKLRNTSYIYGVAIFTGHDSKVMQNSTASPSKRSKIEKKMDHVIIILFIILSLISLISSIGFAARIKYSMIKWWYMRLPDSRGYYDPSNVAYSSLLHLVTVLILYGYLIPISLYVSIEAVKVLQAMFINKDMHMYDEETNKPAHARTSNLNEELGQIETILSDKTGTLTCNQMDFLKCSIAGVSYGIRTSEVEAAAAKLMATEISSFTENSPKSHQVARAESCLGNNDTVQQAGIKGFSFKDDRIMEGNWVQECNADTILLFFHILALCHTAIPEPNEETGSFNYEAESPDEGAFLIAAREFGFEFCKRTQSSVFIQEKYSASRQPIQRLVRSKTNSVFRYFSLIFNFFFSREFKVLNLLEFSSKRKRMSVIVRDEEGLIFLLCKGADRFHFYSHFNQ